MTFAYLTRDKGDFCKESKNCENKNFQPFYLYNTNVL